MLSKKLLALLLIEAIYLICTTYLIHRKNFFIKKFRQWIIIILSFLKIFLVFLFIVDSKISEGNQNVKSTIQGSYQITITLYVLFCMILFIYETSYFLIYITTLCMSSTEVKITSKQNLQKNSNSKENTLKNIFSVSNKLKNFSISSKMVNKKSPRVSMLIKSKKMRSSIQLSPKDEIVESKTN